MKIIIKRNMLLFYVFLFFIISYLSINNVDKYLASSIHLKQLFWYIIGILLILLIKRINIKKLYNFSLLLYIINNLLLIGLFFFGTKINNTTSWYRIDNITIQPSEFMKINLILLDSYIIYKFYKNKEKINIKKEEKMILLLLLVLIIPSILTFLQPDTGAVIGYIIITISMLYISGIDKKWLYLLLILTLIIIITFSITYLINKDLLINIFGKNIVYRIDRIINWKNKSGLQLNNSLIAIGSSGLIGHRKIPLYYPEASTDFIFTSYASSYGLIGIILFFIFIISFDTHLIKIMKNENNYENKYTLFAIISLFFYQQFQSISMTLGLLPINGITLPLISYGGSSILSYLILIGIVQNIRSKQKKL